MGTTAVAAIEATADLDLVAAVDLGDSVSDAVRESGARVAIDLTAPAALADGVPEMIRAGLSLVIGTSGATDEQIEDWRGLVAEHGKPVLIVPNFSLGVVLLQRMAEQAARIYADFEILELHHENKVDSPSGTARDTARRLAAARAAAHLEPTPMSDRSEFRGGRVDDVPIHSVRLPGLLAHQEMWFGSAGELLTLRHDTFNRSAFMPGLCLAARRVESLSGLNIGLEHCLAGLFDS